MAGVEFGPIVDTRWNSRFTRRRAYRVQKRGIESVYKKERESGACTGCTSARIRCTETIDVTTDPPTAREFVVLSPPAHA